MMERPNENDLRQMSYSELRKYARKSGIKGNKKAEDLIASILENSLDDSFVALENKIINSCSKLKVEKFNQDKLIASATPRRDTYTVDSPLNESMVLQKQLVVSSASPMLRKSPDMNDSLNVTMTRGSERKLKKRKVSFVTPVRRSMRLNALTPQFASVKDRPKTPIPNRGSTGRKAKRPSTPLPQSKRRRLSSTGTAEKSEIDASTSHVEQLPLLKEVESETHLQKSGAKKTPITGPAKIGNAPISNAKSKASPCVSATKGKGTPSTPNFSKLHQKAFDKMESIEEHQKRKAAASAKKLEENKRLQDRLKKKAAKESKSRIPKKFGGIPFIPSITNVRDIRTNFAVLARKNNSLMDEAVACTMSKKVSHNESTMSKKGLGARGNVVKSKSCENTPLRKRTKFDIQASLSKKLNYKPHTGPLKPLSIANLNATLPIGNQQKETENRTIQSKRVQSRTLLKGVRTNRRFELQMKNRKPV